MLLLLLLALGWAALPRVECSHVYYGELPLTYQHPSHVKLIGSAHSKSRSTLHGSLLHLGERDGALIVALYAGSPSQRLDLVLDTGSSLLVAADAYCVAQSPRRTSQRSSDTPLRPCTHRHRYNASASVTALSVISPGCVPPPFRGHPLAHACVREGPGGPFVEYPVVPSGALRCGFTVRYEDGTTFHGSVLADVVRLGRSGPGNSEFYAAESYQRSICKHLQVARDEMPSRAAISVPAGASKLTAPPSAALIYSIQLEITDDFESLTADGVIGASLPELGCQVGIDDGQCRRQGAAFFRLLPNPWFAIDSVDGSSGSLCAGCDFGISQSLTRIADRDGSPPLCSTGDGVSPWIPVTNLPVTIGDRTGNLGADDTGFWALSLVDIAIGTLKSSDSVWSGPSEVRAGGAAAVIDSGTSALLLPAGAVKRINDFLVSHIPGISACFLAGTCGLLREPSLPSLVLTFGTATASSRQSSLRTRILISGNALVTPVKSLDASQDTVYGYSIRTTFADGAIILGHPLFRAVVVGFNESSRSIGLMPALIETPQHSWCTLRSVRSTHFSSSVSFASDPFERLAALDSDTNPLSKQPPTDPPEKMDWLGSLLSICIVVLIMTTPFCAVFCPNFFFCVPDTCTHFWTWVAKSLQDKKEVRTRSLSDSSAISLAAIRPSASFVRGRQLQVTSGDTDDDVSYNVMDPTERIQTNQCSLSRKTADADAVSASLGM